MFKISTGAGDPFAKLDGERTMFLRAKTPRTRNQREGKLRSDGFNSINSNNVHIFPMRRCNDAKSFSGRDARFQLGNVPVRIIYDFQAKRSESRWDGEII